jgi:hypothetical protein
VTPANSQEKSHHHAGAGARNGIEALFPAFFHSTLALRLAVLVTLLILLGTAFRTGWMRVETDFPNYDTAARLAVQHKPLRNYYDWAWFVREMNYAGYGRTIGTYAAQTPLTMLPMMGFTRFAPQTAKRIWLVFNLGFLWASVWRFDGKNLANGSPRPGKNDGVFALARTRIDNQIAGTRLVHVEPGVGGIRDCAIQFVRPSEKNRGVIVHRGRVDIDHAAFLVHPHATVVVHAYGA